MNCQSIDTSMGKDAFAVVDYEILGNFKAPHPHDIIIKLKSWKEAKYVHL